MHLNDIDKISVVEVKDSTDKLLLGVYNWRIVTKHISMKKIPLQLHHEAKEIRSETEIEALHNLLRLLYTQGLFQGKVRQAI